MGRVETSQYEPMTEDYFAYVIDAIKLGLEQVERGQTIPHDEVAKCMRQRWQSTTANTHAR
jgi:predicted transcriptional regulator